MKKYIVLVLIVIAGLSCSPKISSTIRNKQKPLNNNDYVLVIQKEDNQDIKEMEIGTIRSSDSGFSTNCSYFEVIDKLKNLARQNGANIIKIIEHKVPDAWSTYIL